MRLALICTEKLPSPAIRGGAIQIMMDGISPFLAKKHEVTIYSITDESLPNKEKRGGIQYIRFSRYHYVDDVADSLGEQQYDVVHVFNRPALIPFYKEAAPSSRFVVSLHNEMFASGKITDKEASLTVRYVHKLTTVSQYIKNTITKRVAEAESKTVAIYSGYDPSRYSPIWSEQGSRIRSRLRSRYGVSNKKVILFVGRLSVKKGPHLLIQALSEVLKEHPDAVLVIVGGKWFSDNTVDSYGEKLLDLAEPYGNRVIFTRYISASDIPDYFTMGDVFVCSSQWQEPLARVHYEAMAAGIPVITTNRGGNAEIVKHKENGYLVKDYTSSSSFASSINHVLSYPDESKQMAIKARKFVEENHTFEKIANRLESIYMEAYNSKPTVLIQKAAASRQGKKAGTDYAG
ncbi:glycosyltransferase family 4 protein [Paenibacillus lupini]|uniref:glycosyltransferase family 4 protein n=1 Tax=Paenibacillus lupini TaxID=1450204 RepID=UPI00141E8EF7|nr:glycosyltransferase family 4 protein [Paenibacillus lupini]NIK22348.1 glycosyltransferase involved in cell wall biosynthesis [Paenibacillus lupini]